MAFDIMQAWQELFANPIEQHTGFNYVNTLIYIAILLVISFLIIYPQLNRRGIKFNTKFMLALFPYIILGSALRVIEDMRLLPRSGNPLELAYYTGTPGIWFLVGMLTILFLFIARYASKKFKMDFYIVFALLGSAVALPVLVFDFMYFRVWSGFALALAMTLALTAIFYLLAKKIKKDLFADRLNILALFSQALDGSATFIATQVFVCGEQHPLSRLLIGASPIAWVLLKIALILLIVYYVDKEIKNPNLRGFIKIFIIIIGTATGTRDLITIGAGTCL